MASVCDALEYRIAERRVDSFADRATEQSHHQPDQFGDELLACEAWLQMGIDACEWLHRAEDAIREASYLGLIELTAELKSSMATLYEKWLAPCERAEHWASQLVAQGCPPSNLRQLLDCKDSILDRIQRQDWLDLAHKARLRHFAAEVW